MGVNVLYNLSDYELLEKQQEVFDKYCRVLQWGRKNPDAFIETFFQLDLLDFQKYIVLGTWPSAVAVWLCSRNTGKSFLTAPYIMARSMLFANHNTYIMAPSGAQSQRTFSKIEDLALGNIASVIGTNRVFLTELVRSNKANSGFTHDKASHRCHIFNGSGIFTLNSTATTAVGVRSNLSVYDEAGKIDRDFFTLTKPFTSQDTNFLTGSGLNIDLYPVQLPNQKLFISSAENADSELFDEYELCFERMLMGDRSYFVVDLNCEHSLHPTMNGKPYRPLVSQLEVDDAMRLNPFRAKREYYNRFDDLSSENALISRMVIDKYAEAYVPVFKNTGDKKYAILLDPSVKRDNAQLAVVELWKDEERGWMGRMVNMKNLVTIAPNGEKKIMMQKDQIEVLKEFILNYNSGVQDYDNIESIVIDGGAGGGGTILGQYLLGEWKGKDRKMHRGFIDLNDSDMKAYESEFPGACDKLTLFNFARDKTSLYNVTGEILSQGLLIFPQDQNARHEIEQELIDIDGEVKIKTIRLTAEESAVLSELELAKEELSSMERTKTKDNRIKYDIALERQKENMHDDRADVCAFACWVINQLRNADARPVQDDTSDMSVLYKNRNKFCKTGMGGDRPFRLGERPF